MPRPIVAKPKQTSSKVLSSKSSADVVEAARSQPASADPLAALAPKKLALRVGLPVAVAWGFALWMNGWVPKVAMGVLTLVVAGFIFWAYRYASRSQKMASLIKGADTKEAREKALEQLGTDYKKDDAAALFAKAQLEMQDDPRKALKTLEQIKLDKVMAPMADEARAQRAMIHLMYSETDEARALADKIDLGKQKETKSRAMVAAIIGEAWARSGQAKKAVDLLGTFDLKDDDFAEVRPQIFRAQAFAFAWSNDTKQMKATLRKLMGINAQLLMGFITTKKNPGGVPPRGVHPMLEKEAYELVVRSGAAPRRQEVRRR